MYKKQAYYMHPRTLLQKVNHLTSLGSWNKIKFYIKVNFHNIFQNWKHIMFQLMAIFFTVYDYPYCNNSSFDHPT